MKQGDLFEISSAASKLAKGQKFAFLEWYKLSLRFDQLMLFVIVMIVLFVLVFSFGVEKGKSFAFDELKAERDKREQMVAELSGKLREATLKIAKMSLLQDQVRDVPARGEAFFQKLAPKETEPVSSDPISSMEAQKKYTIQLVTYKTKTAAQRQIRELSEKGLKGFVIPSGSYLQVCVNAFEDRDKARSLLGRLRSQGIAPSDAYIRFIPS